MLGHVALKALVCVLLLGVTTQALDLSHVVEKGKEAFAPIKAEMKKIGDEMVKAVHPMVNVEADKSHVLIHDKVDEKIKADLKEKLTDVKEKVEDKLQEAKEKMDEKLEEAKPLMNSIIQKLPPFFQSMFEQNGKPVEPQQANDDMLMPSPPQKTGFFSFLLIKKRPETGEAAAPSVDGQAEPMNNKPIKSLILFKISPKKEDEMDGPFNNLHLLGGGGPEDIDRKFFNMQQQMKHHMMLGGGDDDVDRLRDHGFTGTGEDVDHPQQPQVAPFMPPQVPFFNYFLNGKRPYLIPKNERERTTSDEEKDHDSDDSDEDHQRHIPQTLILRADRLPMEHQRGPSEAIKKCLMAHYMRVKASLYHRTVLFMLFMSGLVMFAFLALLMLIRNCKRRRAMRFHGMMNVSAIDSKLNLAPPTYEQLETEKKPWAPPSEYSAVKREARAPSSLVNSLAQAYRSRYTTLVNDKPDQASSDNVSVSSLPTYEEQTAKHNATGQI